MSLKSTGIFEVIDVIGREKTIRRLERAIEASAGP
jgi:hypothetical protein